MSFQPESSPPYVHIGAAAVPGANHLLPWPVPCQDSARGWKDETGAVVLAVADGHGDAKYSHSHVGGMLAAELFVELGRALVSRLRQGLQEREEATSRQWLDQEAARFRERLLSEWRRRVNLNHSMWGAYEHERESSRATGSRLADQVVSVPYPTPEITADVRLYGTTLLGVIAFDEWLLLFQRGDGAIVLAGTEGAELAFPLSGEKQFSSATASMVTPSSSRPPEPGEPVWDYPVDVRNRVAEEIRWISVVSDGVIDAFGSDDQRVEKYLARQLLDLADEGRWPRFDEEDEVSDLSPPAANEALGFRDLWSQYIVPQLLWRIPERFTRDDSSMCVAWWPLREWPHRSTATATDSHSERQSLPRVEGPLRSLAPVDDSFPESSPATPAGTGQEPCGDEQGYRSPTVEEDQ